MIERFINERRAQWLVGPEGVATARSGELVLISPAGGRADSLGHRPR